MAELQKSTPKSQQDQLDDRIEKMLKAAGLAKHQFDQYHKTQDRERRIVHHACFEEMRKYVKNIQRVTLRDCAPYINSLREKEKRAITSLLHMSYEEAYHRGIKINFYRERQIDLGGLEGR